MPDYEKPKQPRKAGFVIASIVLAIAAVIFIGLNMRNADDVDEPAPAQSQTLENAAPS